MTTECSKNISSLTICARISKLKVLKANYAYKSKRNLCIKFKAEFVRLKKEKQLLLRKKSLLKGKAVKVENNYASLLKLEIDLQNSISASQSELEMKRKFLNLKKEEHSKIIKEYEALLKENDMKYQEFPWVQKIKLISQKYSEIEDEYKLKEELLNKFKEIILTIKKNFENAVIRFAEKMKDYIKKETEAKLQRKENEDLTMKIYSLEKSLNSYKTKDVSLDFVVYATIAQDLNASIESSVDPEQAEEYEMDRAPCLSFDTSFDVTTNYIGSQSPAMCYIVASTPNVPSQNEVEKSGEPHEVATPISSIVISGEQNKGDDESQKAVESQMDFDNDFPQNLYAKSPEMSESDVSVDPPNVAVPNFGFYQSSPAPKKDTTFNFFGNNQKEETASIFNLF